MLADRPYMRRTTPETPLSLTVILLIVNAVVFVVESLFYGYPPRFPINDYFALSVEGLRHGFVWQLLTYQFMHGGLLHLLLNSWAIYVFGRAVEESLSKKHFLLLYFSSGVIGGGFQIFAALWFPTHFGGAVVGASAAAFGLVAAFAVLFPERPLTLLLFFIIPVHLRAKFLLLFSALLALFGIVFPGDNVAHAAHLGGMLTGLAYVHWIIHSEGAAALWEPFRSRVRSRELVKVHSQKPSLWQQPKSNVVEDLPPAEFISREVDPILDKISAHGIQSLTERERKILEAARKKMSKR
ncbi:MAG: rhomboid family intramembrane serine protease [Verrucomicrobia bacterium]|nr:rhomboid family intramembrane serine protease [Verrucomicrobiota bacterium]